MDSLSLGFLILIPFLFGIIYFHHNDAVKVGFWNPTWGSLCSFPPIRETLEILEMCFLDVAMYDRAALLSD